MQGKGRGLQDDLQRYCNTDDGKSNVIIIATDLILIIRNLERIIGHMENIAESVIFITDAKIVRHPRLTSGKHKADKENTEETESAE